MRRIFTSLKQTKTETMKTLKETEKAVQIEATVMMEIAPKGGFVSSLIRDRQGKWTFWCPKSVISNDNIASWFLDKKIEEAREYYEDKFYNVQILTINFNVL